MRGFERIGNLLRQRELLSRNPRSAIFIQSRDREGSVALAPQLLWFP
jgi:hypothetical protein